MVEGVRRNGFQTDSKDTRVLGHFSRVRSYNPIHLAHQLLLLDSPGKTLRTALLQSTFRLKIQTRFTDGLDLEDEIKTAIKACSKLLEEELGFFKIDLGR